MRPTNEGSVHFMQTMTAGITKAGTGIDGIVWNILGETYVPKQVSESTFSWHATFTPGTFVPPPIHPVNDMLICMLKATCELAIAGRNIISRRGDLLRRLRKM